MAAMAVALSWAAALLGAVLIALVAVSSFAGLVFCLPAAVFFCRALKSDWRQVQDALSAPSESELDEYAESLIAGAPSSDAKLGEPPTKGGASAKTGAPLSQKQTHPETPESESALLTDAASDAEVAQDFTSPRTKSASTKSATSLFGWRVAVVIPAVNEEASLPATLARLAQLQPAVSVIVVADGGSTDSTVSAAEARGAVVVHCAEKGRSKQMNAGAREAARRMREQDDEEGAEAMMDSTSRDSIICFLHADTTVPLDLVTILRSRFAEPATCCVGFVPLISVPGRIFWVGSFMGTAKTWIAAFLQSPRAFAKGFRMLYGDQGISCCARDFFRVGGFDESFPFFEDADLCERLHNEMGPGGQPGRVCLVPRLVGTSGRRFASSAWRQRMNNFYLAWRYMRRASPEELRELYKRLYHEVR